MNEYDTELNENDASNTPLSDDGRFDRRFPSKTPKRTPKSKKPSITDALSYPKRAVKPASEVSNISEFYMDERNARKRDMHAEAAIQASLQEVGFARSIVSDEYGNVLAGNGTLEQAAAAGIENVKVVEADGKTVVVVRRTGLTDAQKRRLSILDNRTAELATWDSVMLAQLTADGLDLSDLWTEEDWKALMAQEPVIGEEPDAKEVANKTLAERFGVPPFSVMDARQGYWQVRKKAWIALGLHSENGRGENLMNYSASTIATLTAEGKREYIAMEKMEGDEREEAYRVFSEKWSRGAKHSKADGDEVTQNAGRLTYVAGTRPLDEMDDVSRRILKTGAGTSIFDPVLCELAYRWFCPVGGHVLDPFAGGSVRGVVAGILGRRYTGIDLSEVQCAANREQWAEISGSEALEEPVVVYHGNGPEFKVITGADNPIVSEGVELYNATSGSPMRADWGAVTPAKAAFLKHVYDAIHEGFDYDEKQEPSVVAEAIDDGTMWVAFSGGKDSIAAALLAREAGYRVVLYHVVGLNRYAPDEVKYARLGAEALGMPIVVDRVRISGSKSNFIEMPTKNQCLASMMVGRMLECGGAHWCMGLVADDDPETNNPLLSWSDTNVSNSLWAAHLSERVPGLQFHLPIRTELESVALVASHGMLAYAHGCVTGVRFLMSLHDKNTAKYGAAILPHRCGSCIKCWSEYIMLCHLGAVEKNAAFYARCIDGLIAADKEGRPSYWRGDSPESHYLKPFIVEEYKGAEWPTHPAPVETPHSDPIKVRDVGGSVKPARQPARAGGADTLEGIMAGFRPVTVECGAVFEPYYAGFAMTRDYPRYLQSVAFLSYARGRYVWGVVDGCLVIIKRAMAGITHVLQLVLPPMHPSGDTEAERAVAERFLEWGVSMKLSDEDIGIYGYEPSPDRLNYEYIYRAGDFAEHPPKDARLAINKMERMAEAGEAELVECKGAVDESVRKGILRIAKVWEDDTGRGRHQAKTADSFMRYAAISPDAYTAAIVVKGEVVGYTQCEPLPGGRVVQVCKCRDTRDDTFKEHAPYTQWVDSVHWTEHLGPDTLMNQGDARAPGLVDAKNRLHPVATLQIHNVGGAGAVDGEVWRRCAPLGGTIDESGEKASPQWVVGDSANSDTLAPGEYDFIFSCPPYFDLERYSDDPADLSNMKYDEFIAAYRAIIAKAVGMLKSGRFACFVVGDVRAKDSPNGAYRGFVSDTISAFVDAGMDYYNEGILVTAIGSLAIRTGKHFAESRKFGKAHQNVLVFVKGSAKEAVAAIGPVEYGDPVEFAKAEEALDGAQEVSG